MDKKEIVNRTVTLTLKLSKTAQDLGFDLEVDGHEDVFHNGYSSKDIRGKLNLDASIEGADLVFPQAVAQALEDAERDAYAAAIRKARIQAVEDTLLKIDLLGGGAEYQDADGNQVSTKAGINGVTINEAEDSIEVEIVNPEHLINTIVNGVGRFYPDLDIYEPASNQELMARVHHLKDFFEVYGESKPTGELSSQYSPSINDEYFTEEVKFRVSELSLEDIAEAVKECVDETSTEPKAAIELAAKLSGESAKAINDKILEQAESEKAQWQNLGF